jgi:hypothetical protein
MKFRQLLTRMMVLLFVGILVTAYSAPAAYADSASAEMLEKFWVDTYGKVTTTPETMPYVAESYNDLN